MFSEKPKPGIDFSPDMVSAYIHSRMMEIATHLQKTTITFLHNVLEKATGVNPELTCYSVFFTIYTLLISNSNEKVFGGLFGKFDQAIHYNGELQSIAGNKNSSEFLPSNCFPVQTFDRALQVNHGLRHATVKRLETYSLSLRSSSFDHC